MIKVICFCLLSIFMASVNAKNLKLNQSNRVKIGPTFIAPILYNTRLYFISNSGVLFSSKKDFSDLKTLFTARFPAYSGLVLEKGVLYFGEGIHKHKKAYLYGFDIEKKKLVFKMEFPGHIERSILIHGSIASGATHLNNAHLQ